MEHVLRTAIHQLLQLTQICLWAVKGFSLAHELYHLFFDKDQLSTICSSKIAGENENEKKADKFASYFLAPPAALYEAISKAKKPYRKASVIR